MMIAKEERKRSLHFNKDQYLLGNWSNFKYFAIIFFHSNCFRILSFYILKTIFFRLYQFVGLHFFWFESLSKNAFKNIVKTLRKDPSIKYL